MARLLFLALEYAAFFLAVPLLIYYRRIPNLPIPYLLVIALLAFLALRADPTFCFSQLTSWGNIRPFLASILIRDAVCLLGLGIAVYFLAPQLLFSLIRQSRGLWALVFVLYPLLSVYPQEFLYRAFFFHRYQPLFGQGWGMMAASALAFGFVHIIFRNWLAVGLCVIGGFLFSLTYQTSGSFLLACLDHAIFGDFLFTIGLGQYFYHGSRT
ncbi:MAG TPA: CPBP family intramembrane glutamic endopeptidase [Candidatus Sulfotelmatobacter sp.]|jgi:membrane protease YdiL (CAAX protease family)|nr:CPBP family intramembrane glutamic endopeptidase [Candidatus Sulfotelmatobacter sp.]